MIWLLWKLVTLPVRLAWLAVRVVLGAIRFLGPGRILAFGAGVATGMAVAPASGEQLRSQVRDQIEATAATGGDLAAVVRHELASSPRTWHLPQPRVTLDGQRITLTGVVPHDDARHDLTRTAAAVVGVRAVDDQLRVQPSDDA